MTKYLCILCLFIASCKGVKINSLKDCELPEKSRIEAEDEVAWTVQYFEQLTRDRHSCFKVISHVNVVDVESGTVLPNQNVLIHEDSIVEITSEKRFTRLPEKPECVQKIDGSGKFLAPGLCDMHTHYCGKHRFDYLLHGITTVRVAGSEAQHVTEQGLLKRGRVLGPDVYCTNAVSVSIKQADTILRNWKLEGGKFHWLYLSNSITFNTITEYLEYARSNQWPVSIDLPINFTSEIQFPEKSVIEQFAGLRYINRQKNSQSFKLISKFAYYNLLREYHWIVLSDSDFNAALHLVKNNPALFCIGTEAGLLPSNDQLRFGGKAFHEEMEFLKIHGVTNADIVRMGTINAWNMVRDADLFISTDSLHQKERPFGNVKPGYRANLVLLSEDPLKNVGAYSRAEGVFIRGNYLDQSDLQLIKINAQKFRLYGF